MRCYQEQKQQQLLEGLPLLGKVIWITLADRRVMTVHMEKEVRSH